MNPLLVNDLLSPASMLEIVRLAHLVFHTALVTPLNDGQYAFELRLLSVMESCSILASDFRKDEIQYSRTQGG